MIIKCKKDFEAFVSVMIASCIKSDKKIYIYEENNIKTNNMIYKHVCIEKDVFSFIYSFSKTSSLQFAHQKLDSERIYNMFKQGEEISSNINLYLIDCEHSLTHDFNLTLSNEEINKEIHSICNYIEVVLNVI